MKCSTKLKPFCPWLKSNYKRLVLILVFAGFGFVLVLALIISWINVLTNFKKLETTGDKNRFDASLAIVNSLVGGIGTIATVAGGVVLYLNFREATENTRIAEDRLITERFSKAVEQLGSKKLEIRLGGIYSLERIAKDSPDDHGTVMEVLASFIREKSPVAVSLDKDIGITIDIQAALTVIGRRNSGNDKEYKVNLHNANLIGGANLCGANLCGANLSRAHLKWANLIGAKLIGADLMGADLIGVYFSRSADSSREDLSNADLSKAELIVADLTGADLRGVNLIGADLTGADLTGADLTGADLIGADLIGEEREKAIGEALKMIKSAKNWELATYNDEWCERLGLP